MKKAAIIISITLCSTLAIGQDFLSIGNQWIFEHKKFVGPNTTFYEKIDSISVTKDTFINDKTYFKLESTIPHICNIFKSVEYLREEEDKIYRLDNDLGEERLMIDFAAERNFTIQTNLLDNIITSEVIVDGIGTTTLPSGHELKTQNTRVLNSLSFEDNEPYTIYENVGFVNPGMLFPDIGTGLCDVFETMTLKCFLSSQDTFRFTNEACFSSDILDSTIDIVPQQEKLYPNPTLGLITIPNDHTVHSIYDLRGKKYIAELKSNKLVLESFDPGIYIIILESNFGQELSYSKIVKM